MPAPVTGRPRSALVSGGGGGGGGGRQFGASTTTTTSTTVQVASSGMGMWRSGLADIARYLFGCQCLSRAPP
jgi:hypothetical protein